MTLKVDTDVQIEYMVHRAIVSYRMGESHYHFELSLPCAAMTKQIFESLVSRVIEGANQCQEAVWDAEWAKREAIKNKSHLLKPEQRIV